MKDVLYVFVEAHLKNFVFLLEDFLFAGSFRFVKFFEGYLHIFLSRSIRGLFMSITELRGKGNLVDEIGEAAARVKALREKVYKVRRAIFENISEDEELSALLKSIVESSEPPEVPQSKLLPAAEGLKEYEESLKNYFEFLVELENKVQKIEKLRRELGEVMRELEAWRSKLSSLSPYHSAEAFKARQKAEDSLREIGAHPLSETLEELRLSYERGLHVAKVCRVVYSNVLKELEGRLGSLRKLVEKARKVAGVEYSVVIEEAARLVEEAEARLLEAKERMPFDDVDVVALRARVVDAAGKLEEIVSRELGPDERRILEEYGRLVKAYEGRRVRFYRLVEHLSRSTGLSLEDTLKLLYRLEKKNLVRILSKLS